MPSAIHGSRSTTLTPRQAAALVGVSESTVRRWCDRALVATGRTTGRHRRIDQAELLAFARDAGLWSAGAEISLAGKGGRVAPPAELGVRFQEGLVARDDGAVRAFVGDWFRGGGAPDVLFDHVITPALRALGERWATGDLAVYEEHRATQLVLDGLSVARGYLPLPDLGAPVAICAALSGDPYAVAPIMASSIVQSERYRPLLLGADTPAAELLRAARETSASLIVVSIGALPDRAAVRRSLASLAALAAGTGAAVAVGGRALDAALRRGLPAVFFGDTMAQLGAFARSHQRTIAARHALGGGAPGPENGGRS